MYLWLQTSAEAPPGPHLLKWNFYVEQVYQWGWLPRGHGLTLWVSRDKVSPLTPSWKSENNLRSLQECSLCPGDPKWVGVDQLHNGVNLGLVSHQEALKVAAEAAVVVQKPVPNQEVCHQDLLPRWLRLSLDLLHLAPTLLQAVFFPVCAWKFPPGQPAETPQKEC